MNHFIEKNPFILMEAAIAEPLRRMARFAAHPELLISPLIYDSAGCNTLSKLYREYWEIAKSVQLPFVTLTPTWKTDQGRVEAYGLNPSINRDAANFMKKLRDTHGMDREKIKIGGLVGCKNDGYKPEQGLSASASERFHSWQIQELAQTGVDFLIAQTLPNVQEAVGIAKAMEKTGRPYIISFVINRAGKVLDGTDLSRAMEIIDAATGKAPLGYMFNCSYPTFLHGAEKSETLAARLLGCQANASSLDHADLDNAGQLQADDISQWGDDMLALIHHYGLKIMGGCCGTGSEHLKYLADNEVQTTNHKGYTHDQ